MPTADIYFLDTSILTKICEFIRVSRAGRDVTQLRHYYDSVVQFTQAGHKVLLSPVSVLELSFLYHRWYYYESKVRDRAPFDEIFGREATYELENSQRAEIDAVLGDFRSEARKLGIELSAIDQNDVLRLATFLYSQIKPSVEPYDIVIYANAILDSAKYVICADVRLQKGIEYLRKNHKDAIRSQIIQLFGEDKYPYWKSRKDLPCSQHLKVNKIPH